ncbi:DUF3027 domain-containing protein [Bifidobacterium platyrrhinorum]|uniref:DUF3027 domain-containing protein n=1 Tax=Bifidobacterium platyrrhinorum TaxID=2661628 RepID=A0A6L9ST28_9BIFI|nr:DUF3027 domain-containing protein [Bifidobacterium platyrrhinorum]NEG54331.1 DUF3027 domain-containing protein [Bifidobacterium platyrrhinorum]
MTDTIESNVPGDQGAATEPDPRDLARAVAMEVAEEPEQVGDVVDVIDLGDGVADFRLAAHIRGYEGWQWSVTLYHDAEVGTWTVNESSLIPTDDALMPPAWIPWKDRLEPTDLAPTDSIGTDPDDPRLEDGFRRTVPAGDESDAARTAGDATAAADVGDAGAPDGADGTGEADARADTEDAASDGESVQADAAADAEAKDSPEDVDEAVEEFDLSRRHVLSPLGRAQTAKRWYEGPRGPKAMSTKTASGHLCSTCGFFVPLKGELNLLFGVCANKWSPDDGRVVSVDHGCGEHSEIEPPEPSRLWVQSKPAFDDLHIDIIAQQPREDREDLDDDTATEEDIEENTEIDADSVDVEENTVDPGDGPELEAVVDLAPPEEDDTASDGEAVSEDTIADGPEATAESVEPAESGTDEPSGETGQDEVPTTADTDDAGEAAE